MSRIGLVSGQGQTRARRGAETAPRRLVLALIGMLCCLALLASSATPARAQGSAQVYRDQKTGLLVYVADLSGREPGEVTIGYTGQVYWFFNPFNPFEPGFGCAFVVPNLFHLAVCQPPANGLTVRLGPGPNDIRVLDSVPPLPGPNLIQGNKKSDNVQGGRSNEQINTGKGNDKANPGPGEDNVKLGPGNDKANTRDGERDVVDGGGGKDRVTADRKDKIKNVEVVKRK